MLLENHIFWNKIFNKRDWIVRDGIDNIETYVKNYNICVN